jgi:hypothetical protein
MLQGTEFQAAEELLQAVFQILSDIPLETLMTTFHRWMERLQACIDGHGEYRGSISSGASLFSHLLEKMAHIVQTTDEAQLQCLTIELAFPAGR